jgi:hypothetical protein
MAHTNIEYFINTIPMLNKKKSHKRFNWKKEKKLIFIEIVENWTLFFKISFVEPHFKK